MKGFVSVQPKKHLDFIVPPAVVLLNNEAAMGGRGAQLPVLLLYETKNMGGAAHGRKKTPLVCDINSLHDGKKTVSNWNRIFFFIGNSFRQTYWILKLYVTTFVSAPEGF